MCLDLLGLNVGVVDSEAKIGTLSPQIFAISSATLESVQNAAQYFSVTGSPTSSWSHAYRFSRKARQEIQVYACVCVCLCRIAHGMLTDLIFVSDFQYGVLKIMVPVNC